MDFIFQAQALLPVPPLRGSDSHWPPTQPSGWLRSPSGRA